MMQAKEHMLKGLRILVAEDVVINQFFLKKILESEGAVVHIVENGRDAVAEVRNNTFDILLMDVQMPKMDGLEATFQIRGLNDPTKANIPIIALTAHALEAENQRCLEAGMNDFVTKPYTPERLYGKITSILQPQMSQSDATQVGDGELYDLSMLRAMGDGNEGFVQEIINVFLETTPPELTALSSAGQAANWVEVARIAHKLKSAVEHMGVRSIVEPIRRLAQLQESDDVQEVPAMIDQVCGTLHTVFAQLREQTIA